MATTVSFDEEDLKRLNVLKTKYRTKTTTQTLRRCIDEVYNLSK